VPRQAANPFEALADAHRRAILELLHGRERSVREIADEMPITRPAVSRHLRLLKEAGLVTSSADGTRRLYRLHDEGVDAVHAYLQEVWGDAAARFRLAADNTDAARSTAAGRPACAPAEDQSSRGAG
jgi:DNA-binding transcriptional ArsR family regulator